MSEASRKIDLLIVRYLEGELSTEEFFAFEQLVRKNANVRRRFIDATQTAQCIKHVLAGGLVESTRNVPLLGEPNEEPVPDRASILAEVIDQERAAAAKRAETQAKEAEAARAQADARAASYTRLLGHSEPVKQVRHYVIPKWALYGSIAAVVAIIAWLAIPNEQPNADQTPRIVAHLTDQQDAVWAPGSETALGRPMRQGSWELIKGSATVTFESGAELKLIAPARIELIDENASRLRSGKVVADVPTEAIGFTVDVPGMKVIDLGTSFGVSVAEQGDSQVHVFVGKVEAATLDESGKEAKRQLLTKNKAVQFNLATRTLAAIPMTEELFAVTSSFALEEQQPAAEKSVELKSILDEAELSEGARRALVAHFRMDETSVETNENGYVTAWLASNNPEIRLAGQGLPESNIVMTKAAPGVPASLVFEDLSRDDAQDNRYLAGALPRDDSLTGATIFWLGGYERDDSDLANAGRYAYSIGLDTGEGATQLTHQRDDVADGGGYAVEIYNGDTTFPGDRIDNLDQRFVIWRTTYFAATSQRPAVEAFANGVNLNVKSDGLGYDVEPNVAGRGLGHPIIVGAWREKGYNFKGRMSELIIFRGQLNERDIEVIEKYLASRAGRKSVEQLKKNKVGWERSVAGVEPKNDE